MVTVGEHLELLARIAHIFSAAVQIDESLASVAGAVRGVFDADVVTLRLLSSSGDRLEVAAHVGSRPAATESAPPGSSYAEVLAGQRTRLSAGDAGEALALPLQVRDRTFGVLEVWRRPDAPCDSAFLTTLGAVADLTAAAIERARLHAALYRIAQALTSSLELRPMLDQVLAATIMEMGLKAASVRLLDHSGKRLELVAALGLSDRYLQKGAILVSKSPIDQKLLAGEQVALYEVAEEPGFQYPAEAEAEGIHSVLAAPLRVRDRIVGVMRVYSARPRPFSVVGAEFLEAVAGLVAVAIENARLYEALRQRYEGLKADVSEWYKFLSLG
jgi:GAF domain-containing protein